MFAVVSESGELGPPPGDQRRGYASEIRFKCGFGAVAHPLRTSGREPPRVACTRAVIDVRNAGRVHTGECFTSLRPTLPPRAIKIVYNAMHGHHHVVIRGPRGTQKRPSSSSREMSLRNADSWVRCVGGGRATCREGRTAAAPQPVWKSSSRISPNQFMRAIAQLRFHRGRHRATSPATRTQDGDRSGEYETPWVLPMPPIGRGGFE